MKFFTSIHLLLLAYIVVFLVFWELSLQKQSGRIYSQEVITLKSQVDSAANPAEYNTKVSELEENLHRRTMQYVAEGSSFLIVVIIGAFVVYTSFRRRITLSRQQNNFMLSVTHELKSPIAAMKLNLQTLERHKLDEDKKAMLLDRSIKESNRLNDLCNNILFASSIEGGQYKAAIEKFDLAEMAEEALVEYGARYPMRFEEDISASCRITGDKVMLRIALNNLLENAIKYTPADQPVTVSLIKTATSAILSVADRGKGIPDKEKKNIFRKFYRVGNEESRDAQGTGLGLYLTAKVIARHKGKIIIKDNSPSGAVFEICLPL
ncbi:MAG: HAMP domain-containing histidine kinase [Taibaiella sp.]|nr:HAMP domain-containing histidine kinase [Taibaiella sp.]